MGKRNRREVGGGREGKWAMRRRKERGRTEG